MSDNKRVKGHCPKCGENRWADARAEFEERWEPDDQPIWSVTHHRILQCAGCEAVYHQKDHVFSEDFDQYIHPMTGEEVFEYSHRIDHWPAPISKAPPNWAFAIGKKDLELMNLFEDIYTALDQNLSVLAAIGIRTAFDKASESLGIQSALPFAKKLEQLQVGGWIGETEKIHLEILTDAGSAAAHRGWKPSGEQLDIMMSSLEHFLQFHFVARDEMEKLKLAVPKKQQKIKEAERPAEALALPSPAPGGEKLAGK
ncbi:protein of unknown function [Phyllobacterium sp. YR620]|uniref:DUF4145 domain-containing protein n=1 Tax=Phyllobacterium sp. YR620 TaxID=1881066 RepID=UPI00088FC65B|nr:DUF4145 domain-containing protein [Phyllobacterium sp. YR620]SDP47243.1 protein of unknown function [Phyllobacterium sp. YR620]